MNCALVGISVLLLLAVVNGQRGPCYECEMYKENHPHSHPYTHVRRKCTYPCECGPTPHCPKGIRVIQDGCGCCKVCPGQEGDLCNGSVPCDSTLSCHYPDKLAEKGVCQAQGPLMCIINNQTYASGATFLIDCRTQCQCTNGSYSCASLCPEEDGLPSSGCVDPVLVEVPGQCCREWRCQNAPDTVICNDMRSGWSKCSASCGWGISTRSTKTSLDCQVHQEERLCYIRPCGANVLTTFPAHYFPTKHHHRRRSHWCKATVRPLETLHLRIDDCLSIHSKRPKYCSTCASKKCQPHFTTTLGIQFMCPHGASIPSSLANANVSFVHSDAIDGKTLKMTAMAANRTGYVNLSDTFDEKFTILTVNTEWIIKCTCSDKTYEVT